MIFPPPATPSFLSGCSCVLDRQGGWLAAPTLSLPASCSPYRAMHSLWRELVSLPASGELAPPPANQSSEVQVRTGSQHCCFARSASGGEGYASLQTTWDIFSQTPNTAQVAPLSWQLCFHTWKDSRADFESFPTTCLHLTLILTSSQRRRTQPEESSSARFTLVQHKN